MSVENMIFENHQTPEMVKRHRITEAAEIEFENGYDIDKVMELSLLMKYTRKVLCLENQSAV